jgi:hypothetical protein
MYATAAGKTDAPRSVGREFVAADRPGKLPAHRRAKLKRKK